MMNDLQKLSTLLQSDAPNASEMAARLFFKLYEKKLYNFFLKKNLTEHQALELVEEVFFALCASKKKSHIENFEGYMWKIAHNKCCKIYNENKKHKLEELPQDYNNRSDDDYSLHEQTRLSQTLDALQSNPEAFWEKVKLSPKKKKF